MRRKDERRDDNGGAASQVGERGLRLFSAVSVGDLREVEQLIAQVIGQFIGQWPAPDTPGGVAIVHRIALSHLVRFVCCDPGGAAAAATA